MIGHLKRDGLSNTGKSVKQIKGVKGLLQFSKGQVRAHFFQFGSDLVVVNGFLKKSGKTKRRHIEMSKNRMNHYIQTHQPPTPKPAR